MVDPDDESFGIYTETDLDQPTDYSLRYAEQNSDSEEMCEKNTKSEIASDFVQDTVKTYCTEGTPYETPFNFSTATSMSDLRDIPLEPEKQQKKNEINEVKTVKFQEVVDYAEETPLMFSRSSSLASLDSIEQHSIHEDRESVISDFSLMSSGVISPSELPDSPTQTVPPSPKQRKTFVELTRKPTTKNYNENGSVFEDNVMKFKEESTPVQFSRTTSLSSLSHQDLKCDEVDDDKLADAMEKVSIGVNEQENGKEDSEGEDEKILAACISDGKRSNRYRQHVKVKCSTCSETVLDDVEEKTSSFSQRNVLNCDSTRNYCTEDTPFLSPAESNNNLSLLLDRKVNLLKENEDNRVYHNLDVYAVENSPCLFSLRSSLSNLTLDSVHIEGSVLEQAKSDSSPRPLSPLSMGSISSEEERSILQQCIMDGIKNRRQKTDLVVKSERETVCEANNVQLHCSTARESYASDGSSEIKIPLPSKEIEKTPSSSVSSVSESSFTENEKAILQQCIMDGMQFRRNKTKEQMADNKRSTESLNSERERALIEDCIMIGKNSVKNRRHHIDSQQEDTVRDSAQTSPKGTSSIEEEISKRIVVEESNGKEVKLVRVKKELRKFRIKHWLQKLLPIKKKS